MVETRIEKGKKRKASQVERREAEVKRGEHGAMFQRKGLSIGRLHKSRSNVKKVGRRRRK